jgi:hypothetical protein
MVVGIGFAPRKTEAYPQVQDGQRGPTQVDHADNNCRSRGQRLNRHCGQDFDHIVQWKCDGLAAQGNGQHPENRHLIIRRRVR